MVPGALRAARERPGNGTHLPNPKDPEMPTHTPYTEAYLARMARRDGPDDHSVCEHNVGLPMSTSAIELSGDRGPHCGPEGKN